MVFDPGPWRSHRGDDWWWVGDASLSGSFNHTTFAVDDPVEGTAGHLWCVLDATRRQFGTLEIHCCYNDRVRKLLDELQHDGLLRWSDLGNPHTRYARIEFGGDSPF